MASQQGIINMFDMIAHQSYNRYSEETKVWREKRTYSHPEAQWAKENECEFAILVGVGLVPNLDVLESDEYALETVPVGPEEKGLDSVFRPEDLDICFSYPVTICKWGRVVIDNCDYLSSSFYGCRFGEHMMGLHLAICGGDQEKAMKLKEDLAPLVSRIMKDFGPPPHVASSFKNNPADWGVALAQAWVSKVPMYIVFHETGRALSIKPSGAQGKEVNCFLRGKRQYARLDPLTTTDY